MAKSLSMKNKWIQLICGILLVAVAIAVIVLTYVAGEDIHFILFGLVGVVCIVYGLLLIIFNIFGNRDQRLPMSLVYGSLIVAVGFVCGAALPHAMADGNALAWFVGMLLAVCGVVFVVRGFVLLSKIKIGWFLAFLIIGLVLAAAGVVAVVYRAEDVVDDIVYTVLGVVVLIAGAYLIYSSCRKKA